MSKKYFLVTVDVEDWFQVENLRTVCPITSWDTKELRVEKNIMRLLELFDEYNVKATFFVLGWIAKKVPGILREIKSSGHEIGSHGYWHRLCNKIEFSVLKEDISSSKKMIEDIVGERIYGFRAPNFSINRRVVEVLQEEGFLFDSSYNSFTLNPRYGKLDVGVAQDKNNILIFESGLVEIPISNMEISKNIMFPLGGGAYFRLLPLSVFIWGIKKILKQRNWYMFYMHPWEIDPAQPRVETLKYSYRFRHYVNLHKTFDKLKNMLGYFKKGNLIFSTCSNMLKAFL